MTFPYFPAYRTQPVTVVVAAGFFFLKLFYNIVSFAILPPRKRHPQYFIGVHTIISMPPSRGLRDKLHAHHSGFHQRTPPPSNNHPVGITSSRFHHHPHRERIFTESYFKDVTRWRYLVLFRIPNRLNTETMISNIKHLTYIHCIYSFWKLFNV